MKYFIISLFIFSLVITAQEKTPSKEEFSSQLTELKNQKMILINEKTELDNFIKYAKGNIENLDKEISDCNEKNHDAKLSGLIKKYGKNNAMMISGNKIWKGMTIEMLYESWGKPDSVNEDTFSYGKFTQLKYGEIEFFFRDNILIDWEEKK